MKRAVPVWRKVGKGWVREGDGHFLPKLGNRRAVRSGDAAVLAAGGALARIVTCVCGWRATGSTLGVANELWWAHEGLTADDGRAHRVRYEEASA